MDLTNLFFSFVLKVMGAQGKGAEGCSAISICIVFVPYMFIQIVSFGISLSREFFEFERIIDLP